MKTIDQKFYDVVRKARKKDLERLKVAGVSPRQKKDEMQRRVVKKYKSLNRKEKIALAYALMISMFGVAHAVNVIHDTRHNRRILRQVEEQLIDIEEELGYIPPLLQRLVDQ